MGEAPWLAPFSFQALPSKFMHPDVVNLALGI
jgi:hypothetical protein